MSHRTIYTDRVIKDIRSGLGDVPIMEKYQISPAEFLEVLKKIKEIDVIGFAEVEHRITELEKKSDPSEMRSVPRNYMVFTTWISDANDPSKSGLVNDISENGLQVEGISVKVNEAKSFIIRSDIFSVDTPIEFDAECRWVKPTDFGDTDIAGFEITLISDQNLNRLRKLIQQLSLGE